MTEKRTPDWLVCQKSEDDVEPRRYWCEPTDPEQEPRSFREDQLIMRLLSGDVFFTASYLKGETVRDSSGRPKTGAEIKLVLTTAGNNNDSDGTRTEGDNLEHLPKRKARKDSDLRKRLRALLRQLQELQQLEDEDDES